jgi:hypothetical protein
MYLCSAQKLVFRNKTGNARKCAIIITLTIIHSSVLFN